MFMKRRKIANFNNNDMLENQNYPMPFGPNHNNKILTKFCLQHINCSGNSEEVNSENFF